MDGFNLERVLRWATQTANTLACRAVSRNRIGIWRTSGCWPTRCLQSQLDESFVAHQYIIAAQAQSSVDVPFYYWGCGGGKTDRGRKPLKREPQRTARVQRPCFDYQTLGDELDAAGLEWRFYTSKYKKPMSGLWSGYQAVRHIFRGPDWKKDIVTPQKRFLTDVAAGNLASFTWITPLCADSDHPACGGGFGPSWVTSIVNAVGESKFWDSTVDLRAVGRLGRPLRPRSAAVQRIRWAGLPRAADRDLSLREGELRVARAVRDRERAALRRRSLRAGAALRGRRARDVARRRLPRFHAEAAQVRADRRAARIERFSSRSRPIRAFPTSNKRTRRTLSRPPRGFDGRAGTYRSEVPFGVPQPPGPEYCPN